jgi:maleate isomerase
MTDSLGHRKKFGVIAPSTNTSVQPEFDSMRPVGVTNHFSRIVIPDNPVRSDEDFNKLMDDIRLTMMDSVDSVMSCSPDALIMGMSAETFWDGKEGSVELQKKVEARAGVSVAMGSDACQAALRMFGDISRIAVITPYMPVGDAQVHRFFSDCGFDVATVKGLKCTSPMRIAHTSEKVLRDAINEVNDSSVEAIVQVGTNLAMARLAGMAEFWIDKPVIAINTATYWWALRQNGLDDKIQGYGSLLSHH